MPQHGHLNAARHEQKPLYQPCYNFSHVPAADKRLAGSSLQRIDDRQHFQSSMAEMLLLCKEAIRRRPPSSAAKAVGSKPLSLDYLADRMDIDDPCFGYVVRTAEKPARGASEHWAAGMLQGFITVTTFTNWHRSFRWDSQHPAAYAADCPDMEQARLAGDRKWDETGALARGLQAAVRCGDIWNEGIVWPRVAEISLLGAMGCGRVSSIVGRDRDIRVLTVLDYKTSPVYLHRSSLSQALVSLVIEELECMKATAKHNYDYVILQATDNSIPFYEAMGFVRVGALFEDETQQNRKHEAEEAKQEAVVAEVVPADSPEKANAIASKSLEIVTSKLTTYTVKKAGETPSDVAKKNRVDVWDIIFLNKQIFKDIAPTSRLMADTVLHLPAKPDAAAGNRATRKTVKEQPKWHVAKDNETPRSIAALYQVNCLELIEANRVRFPGLLSNSRLKEGTRIKVSHFHLVDDEFKPYAHWTFPDDAFEDGEPSYMMAYKLNRRRGAAARSRPFAESLAVPVSEYQPTSLLLPPSPVHRPAQPPARPPSPEEDGLGPAPKRPLSAYMLFCMEQRESNPDLQQGGMSASEASKIIGDLWRNLPDRSKRKYEAQAARAREVYNEEKERYDKERAALYWAKQGGQGRTSPNAVAQPGPATLAGPAPKIDLYNCVVKLKPGAMTESSVPEYKYWYVDFEPDF